MKLIDQQYVERAFYGSRRMTAGLRNQGHCVNRKRVRPLMAIMGLKAIYRRPRTSQPALGHKVYPYLLRGIEISRPNQVWTSDITYIPMARGFLYLVAIMIGIAGTCYPGSCPTPWRWTSVLRLWKKP
jgi:putative transposase